MIIIPIKWLFHWEYTLFSDKPTWPFWGVNTYWSIFHPQHVEKPLSPKTWLRKQFLVKFQRGGFRIISQTNWWTLLQQNTSWTVHHAESRLEFLHICFWKFKNWKNGTCYIVDTQEDIKVIDHNFSRIVLDWRILIVCFYFWEVL